MISIPEQAKAMFFEVRELPTREWEPCWKRLYLKPGIKEKALNHIILCHQAAKKMSPSELYMSFNITRTILLYGPPGNGKTTLMKGLINTASAIFKAKNREVGVGCLLNAHRLSSHLLGGSPQLVQKAFLYAKEIAEQVDFEFLGIDEIESLVIKRDLTLSESNPVDVARAVNAVLQEIDDLSRAYPNVFIIATSNLIGAIDPAFLDRTDLKVKIDYPEKKQRKLILQDTLEEFNRIFGAKLDVEACSSKLATMTKGFSARQLRKLVFEAVERSTLLTLHPSMLKYSHIVAAVQEIKRRLKEHKETEGNYIYSFNQKKDRD